MATIVLVDDVRAARLLVQRTLERRVGWQVVATVSSPAEAIAACQQHQPDVVFIDMNLPGQGARSLFWPLRQVCPNLRIVAVSTGEDSEKELLAVGAQALINKPLSTDDILAVVDRVLAIPDDDVAQAPRQAAGLTSVPRVVVVEDDQVTRRMLSRMVNRLGGEVVGEADRLADLENTLASTSPDLLLLDVNLGEQSSLDYLAARPELALPPTVIVSSHAERSVVETALRVGAGAYVLKPVQPTKLAAAMKQAMRAVGCAS